MAKSDRPALPELTRFDALALALSLGKPASLAAYAEAELARLWPSTCWQCGAELPGDYAAGDKCPACGVDLVPF